MVGSTSYPAAGPAGLGGGGGRYTGGGAHRDTVGMPAAPIDTRGGLGSASGFGAASGVRHVEAGCGSAGTVAPLADSDCGMPGSTAEAGSSSGAVPMLTDAFGAQDFGPGSGSVSVVVGSSDDASIIPGRGALCEHVAARGWASLPDGTQQVTDTLTSVEELLLCR